MKRKRRVASGQCVGAATPPLIFKSFPGNNLRQEKKRSGTRSSSEYRRTREIPSKDTANPAKRTETLHYSITERERVEQALKHGEEKFRMVIERASDLVSLTTFVAYPRYVYVNPSYRPVLGYRSEDLVGKSPFDFMHPEDRKRLTLVLKKHIKANLRGQVFNKSKGPTERMVYRLSDAWGNWHYLEGTADLLWDARILVIARDVSERVNAEQELQRVREELEAQMEGRTRELKEKSENLEATNTALRVILEMKNRDKKALEQTMVYNVKQLAEPYLEMLRSSPLDPKQIEYLDILKSVLGEIVRPLSMQLMVSEFNLTPSETRVANLIRYGKSSKEIAEILGLSIRTVEAHRRQIRAKLGLRENKINLRSYLVEHPTT